MHNTVSLTDAVRVCHTFAGHTVPPQALVHVISGVAVLHPVVGYRRDHEEYVPDSTAQQTTSHEAVHPAKKLTDTLRENKAGQGLAHIGPLLCQVNQALPAPEHRAILNMNIINI